MNRDNTVHHPLRLSRARFGTAVMTLAALLAGPATADDYPSRPITMVVAFAPGGNVDITARTLAPALSKALGQTVLIDNRAGGGGMIGATATARSAPDGYTLMLGSSGTNATVPAINRNVAYDPIKSFTIIGGVSTTPSLLVVSQKVKASSFAELVKQSTTSTEGLSFGSPGVGSFNHLTLELVKQKSALRATHIPYKGAGQAMTDVISGQIDGMFDQSSSSMPVVRDGRIKAIAQLSERRSPLLPDVPTLAEQGVPGVTASVYTAVFAPAGLPKAIEVKLVAALQSARQDPAVRERLRTLGAEVLTLDQAGFQAYAAQEAQRWRDVAKANNITAQD
jgi:tripartite-type tricarboxylate transporter receptor subunit TctC